MSRFAERLKQERGVFVLEAAARLGVMPVIVEKDYWVCWLLGRLFADSKWEPHLVFKGGTSLSKVFNAISRFSEDIDLSVSPALLGQPTGRPFHAICSDMLQLTETDAHQLQCFPGITDFLRTISSKLKWVEAFTVKPWKDF
jgi:hypothetical protein